MSSNRKSLLVPNEKLIDIIEKSDIESYNFLYPTIDPNIQTPEKYEKQELINRLLEKNTVIRISTDHNNEKYLFIWYLGKMCIADKKYLIDNKLL